MPTKKISLWHGITNLLTMLSCVLAGLCGWFQPIHYSINMPPPNSYPQGGLMDILEYSCSYDAVCQSQKELLLEKMESQMP